MNGLALDLLVPTSAIVPGSLLRIDGVARLVIRVDPYDGPLHELMRGVAVCADGTRVSLTIVGRIWTTA